MGGSRKTDPNPAFPLVQAPTSAIFYICGGGIFPYNY